MEVDGRPYSTGVGAAALGHPAAAVAWLLTKLHGLGIVTQPGDIVLSGALAAMAPVQAGSVVRLMVHRQSAVTVAFE
jgi:2-keto-4-pentenoate hydratase